MRELTAPKKEKREKYTKGGDAVETEKTMK